MRRSLEGQDPVDFSAPENILFRNIDPRSGLLSTERCRNSLREAFIPGTEPRRYCEEKGPQVDEDFIHDEAPEEQ
jgi:membrane carboxypeptidase/penicillin-binding protein